MRMHSISRSIRNQHIQERAAEINGMYRSRLLTLPTRPRKLVFTCNSAALCGGLGDRLKGLVSTFVLALLLDAEFLVDWEEPVRAKRRLSITFQDYHAPLGQMLGGHCCWTLSSWATLRSGQGQCLCLERHNICMWHLQISS